MLLCVVRDLLGESDDAGEVHELVGQRRKKFHATAGTFRLTLRERDAGFFREAVQDWGATTRSPGTVREDAQRRLVRAVQVLQGLLRERDTATLERLVGFIVRHCMLVVVSAASQETAFRIFEVMNNRGLPLAASDILKAEIIGAAREIDEDRARHCREIWESAENQLGRPALQELLANICIVKKRGKLEESVTTSMRRLHRPAEAPVRFVKEIFRPYSDAFLQVREPVPGEDPLMVDGAAALVSLNRLGNRDWQPVALEVLSRFRDAPERVERLLLDLERLAFFLALTSVYYNRPMSRYGAVLDHLGRNPEPDDAGPLALSEAEIAAMREVIDGDVYALPAATRRAIILRLDELMADAPHLYRHGTLTIEHVLPQTPPEGSAWAAAFPPHLHGAWVHRLANLVLLAQHKNARAGTMEFARKKEAYFKRSAPNFALTTDVMGEREWTAETLKRRQARLVGRLARHWRLDRSEATSEASGA